MKQTGQATVLTGKVKSVDPKAGKLTIKTNDREIRLTADSKTTRAALDKLKIGDTARVFEKGGKVIAASPVNTDSKPNAGPAIERPAPQFRSCNQRVAFTIDCGGGGGQVPCNLKRSLNSSPSERMCGVVPSIDFRKTSRSARCAAVSSV